MARGVKTGGRKAGTPNKISKDQRELLKSVLEDQIHQLPGLIDQIDDPSKKVDAILKIMPFIIPKLQAVDLNAKEDHTDKPLLWGLDISQLDDDPPENND